MIRVASIPIITYHAIGDVDSPLWTPVNVFEQHLESFARNGYETVTLERAVSALKGSGNLPGKPIVLTFDDGYQSVADLAWERLKHWGFTGTIFLVTDYCGKTNYWPGQPRTMPEMPLLTWKQAEQMAQEGCEFGAHTRDHSALPSLPAQRIAAQMQDSQEAIRKHIGQAAATFAYPYGAINNACLEQAGEIFAGAVGTKLGIASEKDNLHLLPRIDSYYLNDLWLARINTMAFGQYLKFRQLLRTTKRLIHPDYVPVPVDQEEEHAVV